MLPASSTKEKNVAVEIPELEASQTINRITQRLGELDAPRQELPGQCVWIGNLEIRIPASDTLTNISCVIRHWLDADTLEHDHRGAALNDAEEDVVRLWSLKTDAEAETITIERESGGHVPHDEERRNASDIDPGHIESFVYYF